MTSYSMNTQRDGSGIPVGHKAKTHTPESHAKALKQRTADHAAMNKQNVDQNRAHKG